MIPIVDSVKKKYEKKFDEFRILDITSAEGRDKLITFAITATPTFVIMDKNGKEINRIIGDISQDTLKKFIEQHIKK